MFDDATIEALKTKHEGELVVFDDQGVVLRALTASEFDKYFDDRVAHPSTCEWNIVLRQLVVPGVPELVAMREKSASLPAALARGLVEWAGSPEGDEQPRVDALTATTPSGILEAAGLPKEEAAKLVETYAVDGGQLALIAHAGVAVVVRTPRPDEYQTLYGAISSGKNPAAACRRAARDMTVWVSGESADKVYAEIPGLPAGVVSNEILRLGGIGTEARFRRRARPRRGAA